MISPLMTYLSDYLLEAQRELSHMKTLSRCPSLWIQSREAVMNWLFDFGERAKMTSQTIQLACVLADLFIAEKQVVAKEVYQLIVCICLSIAGKIEENAVFPLDEISKFMNCELSASAVANVEIIILETLQWKLMHPTVAAISRLLLQYTYPNFNFKSLCVQSDAFAALCYCHSELLYERPITIAVASVCAALEKFNQHDFMIEWLVQLHGLYDPNALQILLQQIHRLVFKLQAEDGSSSGSDSTDTPIEPMSGN